MFERYATRSGPSTVTGTLPVVSTPAGSTRAVMYAPTSADVYVTAAVRVTGVAGVTVNAVMSGRDPGPCVFARVTCVTSTGPPKAVNRRLANGRFDAVTTAGVTTVCSTWTALRVESKWTLPIVSFPS